MCGIFGIISTNKSYLNYSDFRKSINELFMLSQTRGKDASGIAFVNSKDILIYKLPLPPNKLTKSAEYKLFLKKCYSSVQIRNDYCRPFIVIGHSRMETNGTYSDDNNNQPVIKDRVVTIHNGIIVNDKQLWKKYHSLNRNYEVDTEVFNSILRYQQDKLKSPIKALQKTYAEIDGAASVATLLTEFNAIMIASNTGSLYTSFSNNKLFAVFASEEYILSKFREYLNNTFKLNNPVNVTADHGWLFSFGSKPQIFSLKSKLNLKVKLKELKHKNISILSKYSNGKVINIINDEALINKLVTEEYKKNITKVNKLLRCKRCILPETMPNIIFNKDGVCNYCINHVSLTKKGEKELLKDIRELSTSSNSKYVVVAFSGGRDSCYGLDYIKTHSDLTPIAYSYDWGMLTDLGRRNQSRVTANLGIEHILISADIQTKRKYIRQNVEAWLKNPHLGTVPLFMAGDKQYFYFANKLMKRFNSNILIMAENPLERTHFKTGFCNVGHASPDKSPYFLSIKDKIKLFIFYFKEFIKNPAYLNSSLIDTFTAYISFYFIPRNYIYLFDYIEWNENNINNLLFNKFNWETASDTQSTWRIGDGTAAFYNYIYYTVAGFTENDTFRSNQIRENQISRSDALKMSSRDNKPRVESLVWYGNTMGVDMNKAIKIINKIPKRFV